MPLPLFLSDHTGQRDFPFAIPWGKLLELPEQKGLINMCFFHLCLWLQNRHVCISNTICFAQLNFFYWGTSRHSIKGQMVKVHFSGHTVLLQLFSAAVKVALGNTAMSECGCVLIKLYSRKQVVGQIWPVGTV